MLDKGWGAPPAGGWWDKLRFGTTLPGVVRRVRDREATQLPFLAARRVSSSLARCDMPRKFALSPFGHRSNTCTDRRRVVVRHPVQTGNVDNRHRQRHLPAGPALREAAPCFR